MYLCNAAISSDSATKIIVRNSEINAQREVSYDGIWGMRHKIGQVAYSSISYTAPTTSGSHGTDENNQTKERNHNCVAVWDARIEMADASGCVVPRVQSHGKRCPGRKCAYARSSYVQTALGGEFAKCTATVGRDGSCAVLHTLSALYIRARLGEVHCVAIAISTPVLRSAAGFVRTSSANRALLSRALRADSNGAVRGNPVPAEAVA
eukprot:IDg9232t1